MKNEKDYRKFLQRSVGTRFPYLTITQDEGELKEFEALLKSTGYLPLAANAIDEFSVIERPHRIYLAITGTLSKINYDFLAQYPTGQVQLQDSQTMRFVSLSPHYNESSVIVLTTNSILERIRIAGKEITDKCGSTFQSVANQAL